MGDLAHTPQVGPTAPNAIASHVEMLHTLADGLEGVLVVTGFGEDPQTGRRLPSVVSRFEIGDKEGMLGFIDQHLDITHLNLYTPLAVYRSGLSGAQRGSEKDIRYVLGLVADFDDPDAVNYRNRLPVPPNMVVETSRDRFQAFYLFDGPVAVDEARPVAAALKAHCECDNATADLDHVWRINGTRNWPNQKKVREGRSPEPQAVTAAQPWTGNTMPLAELREALAASIATADTDSRETVAGTYDVDFTLDPDCEPPRKLADLKKSRAFRDLWDHKIAEIKDNSLSSYDFRIALFVAKKGWSDQAVVDLLVVHRREHGDTDKIQRRDYFERTLLKTRQSIATEKGELEQKIEKMNSIHAVVHTGTTVYLREEFNSETGYKSFKFESRKSLLDWYENKTYQGTSLAKLWLEHPNRREYNGVVFAPGQDIAGCFNLFQGFPVEPRKGDCSLFWHHAEHVICSGNAQIYGYFRKWLAHLFRKPAELPGTAVVLRGRQGTGKNTVVDYIGRLVGAHFLEVAQMGQLVGRFNSHLADKLLVHANEAIWGGSKEAAGSLKAMITDRELAVEGKGKDIYSVQNYKRLIVSSNNDWVVPRDMDDRRFLILDVSDNHKEDHGYFHALHSQMEKGGLEALMHDLMQEDLSEFNIRRLPASAAGFDIKLLSADSFTKWVFEILDGGFFWEKEHDQLVQIRLKWRAENIDQLDGGSISVPVHTLFDDYTDWCKEARDRHPDGQPLFGKKLKDLFPTIKIQRPRVRGKPGPRRYLLPSLETCRALFEQASKEGPEIWTSIEGET